MTPDRKAAIESVLEMLREDIDHDVKAREGLRLTGRNVSQALGEIAAQVDCLAHVCQALLADIDPTTGAAVNEAVRRGAENARRAAEVHS
jgi:hypothetical protein